MPEDEREQLLRWSRQAKSAQSLALLTKIVLACADGLDNTQVVARLRPCWRRWVSASAFRAQAFGRPGGRAACGGPRTISDQIEAVIVATLERTPKDATHWSRASMAAESGLSLASIVPVLSSLAAGDWP